MQINSSREVWRAAELRVHSVEEYFRQIALDDPAQDRRDGAAFALRVARRDALQALRSILELVRPAMPRVVWAEWHRRLNRYERRLLELNRRVLDLEVCLSAAQIRGQATLADDEMLRGAQHLLGLMKHELSLLLAHPQHTSLVGRGEPH